MAKSSRSRRSTRRLTRPTLIKSLGHTVSRRSDALDFAPAFSLADIRRAFSGARSPTVRSPLIRTVRTGPPPLSAPPKRTRSPAVAVRATMRSSDRRTRSPFLNATTVTPQLAERAIICAKRTIRREVLFARNETGKGSRSPRKPKSKVRC